MAAIVDVRANVKRLAAEQSVSLAELSRILDRGDRWLDRYVREGFPAALPADARATLARFFGVSEWDLGGTRHPDQRPPPRGMRTSLAYTNIRV